MARRYKALALKRIIVLRRCKVTDKLVSINLLEFAVEIINYAVITVLLQTEAIFCNQEYLTQLNLIANMTTLS